MPSRRSVLVLGLVACGDAAPKAPPKGFVEPGAAIVMKTSFTVVPKAKHAQRIAELAPLFPPGSKIEIDFAGMPRDVKVPLTAPIAEADRVKRALAFLEEHAEAFGILDPKALVYELDGTMIRVGVAPRWSGNLVVTFDDKYADFYGHLWPVSVPAIVKDAAKLEAVVSPAYGKKGQFLSHCLKECNKDRAFVIDKTSFTFHAGMAFVCTKEGVHVRAAIAIDPTWPEGSKIEGGSSVPALVDPVTMAAIPTDGIWFMAAGGVVENGVTKTIGGLGFDNAGPCFDP